MANHLCYPLAKPLLVIKQPKGFLACAYIDIDTCNNTREACAIVSGVSNYEQMKQAPVIAVSIQAQKLGVQVGDTGQTALDKMS